MQHTHKHIALFVAIEDKLYIHRHRCYATITPHLRQTLNLGKRDATITTLRVHKCKQRNNCRVVTEAQCCHLIWRSSRKHLIGTLNDIAQEQLSILVADISKVIGEETDKAGRSLAVEVKPLENFWEAEEYHQKYLDKNPLGYCHIPRDLLQLNQ